MKQKKLLDKLMSFFDADERERQEQKADIKEILKKLKKRERKLKEKLGNEKKEEKRTRIQQDIDVIYAQRNKGVKLLKELSE
jgi:hypothetical protein